MAIHAAAFAGPMHQQGGGLLRSNDIDEMRTAVARFFCDHRLNLRHGTGGLNAQLQVQPLADVTVVKIEYGAPVVIEPGVIDDFYLFRVVLSGVAQVEIDGTTYDADCSRATVINPTQRTRILPSQDCRSLLLRLSRSKMEQLLCERLRSRMRRPLLFNPPVDLSDAGGARVWRFTQYLLQELAHAPQQTPLIEPYLASKLEHILMSLILRFIPNNYSSVWERAAPVISPRHVRRAIAHIEAHFDQPLTLGQIAEQANVSARTLANGFRRFHGQTPMEYLRNTRLERAHDMLGRAGASESVTNVAYMAGFRHLGRFSAQYKSRYGCMPSDTLRKA